MGALTERGGVEAAHRGRHEEVSDLPEGQQARGVVPYPLLLRDETLQLLLEGLQGKRRDAIRKLGKIYLTVMI